MARTVTEIFNEMIAEKAKYSSLDDLSSTKASAVWRSIMYIAAVSINVHEQLMDVYKTELVTLGESLPNGTLPWYANKLLEFQQGYSLIYNRNNGNIEYSTIDEDAKIIKVATAENEADTVILKCAKFDDDEKLIPLTENERLAAFNYMRDVKFAGTLINILSYNGDELKLYANVKIDPKKITSSGALLKNPNVFPVEDAINSYLNTFYAKNFNSELSLTSLTEYVKSIDGVKDFVITEAYAKPFSSTAYTDVLLTQFYTYKSDAGYLNISDSFPLSTTLTYVI